MKIVYLAAYFYPEKYASDGIYTSILEELAKENEVFVITPQPSRGVTEKEYLEYLPCEEKNGVKILRFPMEKETQSTVKRILRYKKCEKGYKKILKTIKDVDCIFAASTPPTMGIFAGKQAKKIGAKFIYSVQDVFPDSLVSSGILKSPKGPIWNYGRRIERKTYALADDITVISKSFYRNLEKKGVPEEKLHLIQNWVDLGEIFPVKKQENSLFEEYGLSKDKFTVVYAGNMGAAQGAEILLQSAKKLKERRDIQFVVFGGGVGYKEFEKNVQENGLSNVVLNPLLPKSRVSEVYSAGDVALIIGKKGVGKTALPSKTWSIMACNTAIIASFDLDSELAEVIKESKAGVCVFPEDVDLLCKAIVDMSNCSFRVSSRQYLRENLSKEILLKKYIDLFYKK